MKQTQEPDIRNASLLAKDQYLREVRWLKRLTREEEERLVQRIIRGKQEKKQARPNQWVLSLARDARDRLVEHYQQLIVSVAWQYVRRCRSMELLDLVQEANVALIQLIEGQEYTCGKHLCAMVLRRVPGAMLNAIRDRDALVRVAAWVGETKQKVRAAQRELTILLGRSPGVAEVAQHVGITPEKVLEVMDFAKRAEYVESISVLSLREERGEDCYDFVSLYQHAEEEDRTRLDALSQAVQTALAQVLTDRQCEVVQLRYGLGDGQGDKHSFKQIAERLGTVESNIQKIEKRAKESLRYALAPVLVQETVGA